MGGAWTSPVLTHAVEAIIALLTFPAFFHQAVGGDEVRIAEENAVPGCVVADQLELVMVGSKALLDLVDFRGINAHLVELELPRQLFIGE